MKKLMMGVMLALSLGAFATEANLTVVRNPPTTVMRDWTPLSLTLISPVALPPGNWDIQGLQLGVFCWAENVNGVQAGVINTADVVKGLQIGGINVTHKMYGVQIGLINVIQDNDIPFLPILNCYF